jgi:uncharacterized membrane protein
MSSTITAEALFVSSLQPSDHPTTEQLTAAVRDVLRRCGGEHGCASVCALEYGDHPDTAAARMRWAIAISNDLSRLALIAA